MTNRWSGLSRAIGAALAAALTVSTLGTGVAAAAVPPTTTPIHHVVVIFQENASFDHYFGTYPHALNPTGEPAFHAAPGTPSVNGLTRGLLTHNPNLANPFRLDRTQAVTCDNDHGYTAEQEAYDHGLLDKFVQYTGARYGHCNPDITMGYYDGNTVTALWNYAQHFALSDNAFDTTFGPSSPGAINLIAAQTHGAVPANVPGHVLDGTLYNDTDPAYDDCSNPKGPTVAMTGRNVGDLLDARGITWGWFEGGFTPTARVGGRALCRARHANVAGHMVGDYIPHHEPFQYYASTANPHHLPPSSPAMIGHTDQANHQYGLRAFWLAANAGHLPAVSFLKAPAYEDGHPGYSDPLDEQRFLVDTINRLERLPQWGTTAVFITWDDSDGWYDHVMPPIIQQSRGTLDALSGPGACGTPPAGTEQGGCGLGPRIPLLVISPWARVNAVDHHLVANQASILRFIEDNWSLGRIGAHSLDARVGTLNGMFSFATGPDATPLFLDPATGEPVGTALPLLPAQVAALPGAGGLVPWQVQWLETGGASGVPRS